MGKIQSLTLWTNLSRKARWRRCREVYTDYTSWSLHNTLFLVSTWLRPPWRKSSQVTTVARHSHCPRTHISPQCLCWTSHIVRSLVCCPHLRLVPQDPVRLPHPLQEVGATAQARPLAGVSLAEWLTQPQTQVMCPSSPTSSATRIRSTRRSTFLTATMISCAQTTSPWFPPVQRPYRTLKHSAPAKKPQLAEFRHCSVLLASGNWVQVMCRVVLTSTKLGAELDRESVATTFFC